MKLPNSHRAVVDRRKITDYLLNPAHPDNGGKARAFHAMGFRADSWEVLADALRDMARSEEARESVETVHGRKYVLDGTLRSSSGTTVQVRAIWIIDRAAETPRVVTAYPRD